MHQVVTVLTTIASLNSDERVDFDVRKVEVL